jgi:pimeloyl-ACP methyl ester carboxylesterase
MWPVEWVGFGLAILGIGFLLYAKISAGYPWKTRRVRVKVEPGKGKGKAPFVMVHAYRGGSWNFAQPKAVVDADRPDADVMLVDFPSHTFSNVDPLEIAAELNDAIDNQMASSPYASITLVGYSMGALLVRKAFVYACNQADDDPLWNAAAAEKDWAGRVDRVILMAGTNRGWSFTPAPKNLNRTKLVFFKLWRLFSRLTGTARMIRACERGEPFVANLRIQWIRTAREHSAAGRPWPTVVQLLGTVDDVVSDDDNRDVTVSQDFIFVPVRGTGHMSILDFRHPAYGKERADKFRNAIVNGDLHQLRETYPPIPVGQAPNVERVIFVLHGIRDMAEWTDDLEVSLKEAYTRADGFGGPDRIKVIKSSYGYFAMLPFLLYSDRQRNVRWFMDEYTEVFARYPNAKEIDFVGHSNGTYILASALKRYRTLRVNRVAFAGSVVPRAYDWRSRIDAGQVRAVRNYVGSADIVVGIFPHFFELCGSREIGSAGFNGFVQDEGKDLEEKFIPGNHGCAIDSRNYKSIVDFLLRGEKTHDPQYYINIQPSWAVFLSRACWLVWIIIVLVVLGLGWWLSTGPWGWPALAVYTLVVLLILITA